MIPTRYNLKKVYKGTVEQLREELAVLTLENIKRYPGLKPEAARTILLPYIWDGRLPSVEEARRV